MADKVKSEEGKGNDPPSENEKKTTDQKMIKEINQLHFLKFPDHYILKGNYNEPNSYDDFIWWLSIQLSDAGLWAISVGNCRDAPS